MNLKLIPITNTKPTVRILCTIFLLMNTFACAKPQQTAQEKEAIQARLIQEEASQQEIKILKEDMDALKEEMRIIKEEMQASQEDPEEESQDPQEEIQDPEENILTPKTPVPSIISGVLSGTAGQKILSVGKTMALETKDIIQGSCWDYINTVYNRAGYPSTKRTTVFATKKDNGPYANTDIIEEGDWLYYINHSYNGVEHSGIFVNWVDESKKIANILSYGGEHRQEPGRYKDYDLSNVYTVIRAED